MKILIIGPAKCGKTVHAGLLSRGLRPESAVIDEAPVEEGRVFQEPTTADWIVCAQRLNDVPLAVRVAAHVAYVYKGRDGDVPLWRATAYAC